MFDQFPRSADSSSDMEMTGPSMDRSRELSDRRAEMSMYGPSTGPHGTHADASVLSSRQVRYTMRIFIPAILLSSSYIHIFGTGTILFTNIITGA